MRREPTQKYVALTVTGKMSRDVVVSSTEFSFPFFLEAQTAKEEFSGKESLYSSLLGLASSLKGVIMMKMSGFRKSIAPVLSLAKITGESWLASQRRGPLGGQRYRFSVVSKNALKSRTRTNAMPLAETALDLTTPAYVSPANVSKSQMSSNISTGAVADMEEVDRIRAANESQRSMATGALPTLSEESSPRAPGRTIGGRTNEHEEILADLTSSIERHAALDNRIQVTESGQRAFFLDCIPPIELEVYRENNLRTAEWITRLLSDPRSQSNIAIYIGFESFYDLTFESFAEAVRENNIPLVFSPLVKSTREYIQNRSKLECLEASGVDWHKRVIVHLGASHAMDRLLFQEDEKGYLQAAWTEGRLVLMAPELTVVDTIAYRAGLSQVLKKVVASLGNENSFPTYDHHHQIKHVKPCDHTHLDQEIEKVRKRVDDSRTMEEAFAEVYRFVIQYVERGELDSPLYFDSGWEAFHLYKSLSQLLAVNDMKVPWTRLALINARNAAIGDSLHTFYATAPEAFPFVVCGDTAALLAGGISMLNIHGHNRFGVIIIPNNRGMAIEDVISKRSVDGHKYQYEYVKLDRKRDVFTLAQLKDVIKQDILSSLRDHLWGVSAHRSEALVLNIDVQSLRKENAGKAPTDAVLMGGSFLSDDFGERFKELQNSRRRLESIVRVLYDELNSNRPPSAGRGNIPVKIQGCSAIEFMEIMSQLSITMRDKLKFLPTPTDLLATRTLLPSLIESPRRTVSAREADSNFVNSNNTFSVFVSNAAFGLDGLNNLISTHLEYGTGTLVHLAYDAADVVTHYSLIGQVHRNFGIRPSTILPTLYRNHQVYEGQILLVETSVEDENDVSNKVLSGLRNPEVKIILVDMGAPNLTASLK